MVGLPLITDAGPEIVQAIYVGASVIVGTIVVGALILVIAVRRIGDSILAVRNQVVHLRGDLLGSQPESSCAPLNAEQVVDVLAETTRVILEDGFGREPLPGSHLGGPHWRLARAIGVTPRYQREMARKSDPTERSG